MPSFTSADEAYWQGFKDGYRGIIDTVVENYHRSYERGFVIGFIAKKDQNEIRNRESDQPNS
jgi:hypothetical protein